MGTSRLWTCSWSIKAVAQLLETEPKVGGKLHLLLEMVVQVRFRRMKIRRHTRSDKTLRFLEASLDVTHAGGQCSSTRRLAVALCDLSRPWDQE